MVIFKGYCDPLYLKKKQPKHHLMTTVLSFGTFDTLHEGHKHFLQEAKEHGDILVVVVARDSTVKKVKGQLPVHNEEERLHAIQELEFVDHAMLGNEGEDKYTVVVEVNPDVIFLGYDQFAFTDQLEQELAQRGLRPQILRSKNAHKPDTFKSSIIRKGME